MKHEIDCYVRLSVNHDVSIEPACSYFVFVPPVEVSSFRQRLKLLSVVYQLIDSILSFSKHQNIDGLR